MPTHLISPCTWHSDKEVLQQLSRLSWARRGPRLPNRLFDNIVDQRMASGLTVIDMADAKCVGEKRTDSTMPRNRSDVAQRDKPTLPFRWLIASLLKNHVDCQQLSMTQFMTSPFSFNKAWNKLEQIEPCLMFWADSLR